MTTYAVTASITSSEVRPCPEGLIGPTHYRFGLAQEQMLIQSTDPIPENHHTFHDVGIGTYLVGCTACLFTGNGFQDIQEYTQIVTIPDNSSYAHPMGMTVTYVAEQTEETYYGS